MATRNKYAVKKQLNWVCITGSLYMAIQTAVLIGTLVKLGVGVRWESCNIFSTQDHVAAAVMVGRSKNGSTEKNPIGMPVFAWKGETLEEYWNCTFKALSFPEDKGANLIVYDGGGAALLVHKGYKLEQGSNRVNGPADSNEEKVIKDLFICRYRV